MSRQNGKHLSHFADRYAGAGREEALKHAADTANRALQQARQTIMQAELEMKSGNAEAAQVLLEEYNRTVYGDLYERVVGGDRG